MVNRRDFLHIVGLGIVGFNVDGLDIDRLLWVPNKKKILIPTAKQLEFFNSTSHISLYGIPYHEHDGFTGIWLGLERKQYESK